MPKEEQKTEVEEVHAAIDAINDRAESFATKEDIDKLATKNDVEEAKAAASDVAEKYTAAMEALTTQMNNIVKNTAPIAVTRETPHEYERKGTDGKASLQGFAAWLQDVKNYGGAFTSTASMPERMQKYAKVLEEKFSLNISDPATGGFLIPVEQQQTLMELVDASTTIAERTTNIPISGNSIEIPRTDISSLANGGIAGGYEAFWEAEGSTGTETNKNFGNILLRLHKLFALTSATGEFLQDSPIGAAQLIQRGFAQAINFKREEAIVRGTGAGQPKGILNDNSRVTVAKESLQAAKTIIPENVANMRSRLYQPLWNNAVWLVNQDATPALDLMSLAVGTGGVPVYMPMGGLSAAPYDTLYGKPVIFHEQCSTLGTEGDIILVDLSQYLMANKGMTFASSVHVYFTSDKEAFRMIMRTDGQGWWKSAITPVQGSNTLSWCVTLATRA